MRVLRSLRYLTDLDAITRYIAAFDRKAAWTMRDRIDAQVSKLADPNHPRRIGRVPGTFELVAHRNYIVIFRQDVATVTILRVVHARRRHP